MVTSQWPYSPRRFGQTVLLMAITCVLTAAAVAQPRKVATATGPLHLLPAPDGVTLPRTLAAPGRALKAAKDGKLTVDQQLDQIWADSDWENEFRWLYMYNSNADVENVTFFEWTGGSWNPVHREWNLYDETGRRLAEAVIEIYQNGVWGVSERFVFSYDANGTLASIIAQLAGGPSGWQNTARWDYQYTPTGSGQTVVLLISEWGTAWNAWSPMGRVTDVQDELGRLVESVSEFWVDTPVGKYEPSTRTTCTHNASRTQTICITQLWFAGEWMDTQRENYLFDLLSRLRSLFAEDMDFFTQEWVNSWYESHEYDEMHGEKTEIVFHYWNGEGWDKANRSAFTWSLKPGVGVEPGVPEHFSLAQNYPNPFNPSTEISFTLSAPSRVELVVMDVLGREVARLVDGGAPAGTTRLSWNASSLPSGMYVYRLTTNEGTLARTAVLLR